MIRVLPLLSVVVALLCQVQAAPSQPHIVFILADDLGWTDIGYNANANNLHNDNASQYHLTPQINRLADMGMTFTRAYAAPNCAPTRAAFHTGLAASRHGITSVFDRGGLKSNGVELPNNVVEMDASFTTVAETLKSAGYATGHFGKWHIGLYDGPNAIQKQGFDINVGGAGNQHSSLTSGDDYHADSNGQWTNGTPDKTTEVLPKIIGDPANPAAEPKWTRTAGEHMSDALTAESIAWMSSEVAANPNTPVFLYLAHHATHSPIDPKASDVTAIPATSADPRHTRQNYAALLYGMDRSVGDLLDYLENNNDDLGNPLIDNTVFVFMSDNGAEDTSGAGRNSPLRGAKGSQYEGGVRVPAFISTPAMRTAGLGGSATSQAIHVQDFHSTLAALASASAPVGLDGQDFSQVLTDPSNTFSRDVFEWWLQQPSAVGEGHATLHSGNMKLIWYPFEAFNPDITARFDLFDLGSDFRESRDLSGDPAYRATLEAMAITMGDKLEADGAALPFDENTSEDVPLTNTHYAYDDDALAAQGGSVAIDVLANDFDPNSEIDLTTVQVVGAATEGVTTVNPTTGVITYTHNGANRNPDSFTYTFQTIGAETSNEAAVSLTVAVTWDGDTDSVWGTATNWVADALPTSADAVLINTNTGLRGGWILDMNGTHGFAGLTFDLPDVGIRGNGVIDAYGDIEFTSNFTGANAGSSTEMQANSSGSLRIRSRGNHDIINNSGVPIEIQGNNSSNTVSFLGLSSGGQTFQFGGTGDFHILDNVVVSGNLERIWTTDTFTGTVALNNSNATTGPNFMDPSTDLRLQGGTLTIAVDEQIGDTTMLAINDTDNFGATINAQGIAETAGNFALFNSDGSGLGTYILNVDGTTALAFQDFRQNTYTGNALSILGWVEGSSSLTFANLGGTFYDGTIAQGAMVEDLTINGLPAFLHDTGAVGGTDWAVRSSIPITAAYALMGDDLIGDATPLLFNGGSLALAGFSDAVGVLFMDASSSLDVSGGGAIRFADSSTQVWTGTLSISGTLAPKMVRFGTDENGLSPAQLAAISFPNGGNAALDNEGYLEIAITTPSDLSGALAWLDAQDAATITQVAGVSQWSNKIGGGVNNAVQADASEQPDYNLTGINGLPALEFDGVDDALIFQSALDTTPGGLHLFVVTTAPFSSPHTGGDSFQRIVDTDSATNSYQWEILRPALGRDSHAMNPHVLSTRYDSGKTVETFTLAGNAENNSNRFEGTIGELVLYDRELSLLERAAVVDFLNPRWSIPNTEPNYSFDATPTLRALGDANGIVMTIGVKDFYNYSYQTELLDTLEANFGGWVAQNDFKMNLGVRPSSSTFDFTNTDLHVAAAAARDMEIRGHTLIWHKAVPGWMSGTDFDEAAEIEAAMNFHIDGMLAEYAGEVAIWDVVNEVFDVNGNLRLDGSGSGNSIWQKIDQSFDGEYIDKAFIRAAAADPTARLILNDFGIEVENDKSDAAYAFVQDMIARGTPIDGVGFQMHIDVFGINYTSMLANFQRFSDLGLELHITEMDVNVPEIATQEMLEQQASVYRQVLEVAIQVENFKSFSVWGSSDLEENTNNSRGYHKSLVLDEERELKPAYDEMRQKLEEAVDSDVDGDGLSRTWEVLTGTNPFDGASAAPPSPLLVDQFGSTYFAVEFPYSPLDGVDLFMEGATDLSLGFVDLVVAESQGQGGDAFMSESGGVLTIQLEQDIDSSVNFVRFGTLLQE